MINKKYSETPLIKSILIDWRDNGIDKETQKMIVDIYGSCPEIAGLETKSKNAKKYVRTNHGRALKIRANNKTK